MDRKLIVSYFELLLCKNIILRNMDEFRFRFFAMFFLQYIIIAT